MKRLCRLGVLIVLTYGILAIVPPEWHHPWITIPAAVLVLWADWFSDGVFL